QLKARKLAELYSPHFAYFVLVTDDGSVRLLRSEFYYWKNEIGENDLILLTGDSQPQTIEGQYEIADSILEFAKKKNVKFIVTIGGYRKEVEGEPQIFAFATNPELLNKALEAGAKNTSSGNPIVGIAGLLLGLAKFKEIDAVCLLVETPGYISDPKAAKSVLRMLLKMLNLEVSLEGLDKEIRKSEQVVEKFRKIEEQMKISDKRRQKIEEEKVSYIS
ncbi:MAG: PAC2 family protein, partial [Candidatus Bathyarchaeia archaeon]